jgi:hypothetical protein
MTPEEVVDAAYAGFMSGNPEAGLAHCSEDAQWHPVTPLPGYDHSLPLREYFGEFLTTWLQERPDYSFEIVQRITNDDLVISAMRSNLGSGVMVFRVKDDKLTDIWAINNEGRGSTDAF